jgi:hypothetical protein
MNIFPCYSRVHDLLQVKTALHTAQWRYSVGPHLSLPMLFAREPQWDAISDVKVHQIYTIYTEKVALKPFFV